MNYYWELITKDGTRLEIPPDRVDVIKRRMIAREPINTKSQMIPYSQIDVFRQTEKIYSDQNLVEEASRAFNEPLLEGEDIKTRWVKKMVTKTMWDKHYSNIPGYRILSEDGSSATVAFKLPVHQINPAIVMYCTEEEINKATSRY